MKLRIFLQMIFSRKEFEKFSLIESELENYRAGNCSKNPPSLDHSLNSSTHSYIQHSMFLSSEDWKEKKLFLILRNKKGIFLATALVLDKLQIINHFPEISSASAFYLVITETILSLKRMKSEKLVVFAFAFAKGMTLN